MTRWAAALLLAPMLLPAAAAARDYCPTRPSLGQSPCTIDAGRIAVESALVDWERDVGDGTAEDRFLLADTLLRIGLADRIEAQVNWTPLGVVRTRDAADVRRQARVGDLQIGGRADLLASGGDGEGPFAIGLQPSVTIPIGRAPVGDTDWSAGVIVPVSLSLSNQVSLQLSPEVTAQANADIRGRHLRYGSVVGLEIGVTDAVSATVETLVQRDDDPTAPATQWAAAASAGWMLGDDMQVDFGGVAGLNADTPDIRIYAGISRRF